MIMFCDTCGYQVTLLYTTELQEEFDDCTAAVDFAPDDDAPPLPLLGRRGAASEL